MRRARGQVLVEYILLCALVLMATVVVVRFIVFGVFQGSLAGLKNKTTQCVSNINTGQCQ